MSDKYPPGTKIKVKVGGKKYKTIIDEFGVQRFKTNSLLRYLIDEEIVSLNDLALFYADDKFSKRHYAEFYMMIGYSVSGLSGLSSFDEMEIENPVWEK